MKESTKKKLIFWGTIYLFFQLPLAILAFTGRLPTIDANRTLRSLIFERKDTEIVSHVLKEGKMGLYDFSTGEKFGHIHISFLEEGDYSRIKVSYKTNAIYGSIGRPVRDYFFEPFDINDFVLEKREFKGEYFWIGSSGEINMVITRITNSAQGRPIPLILYQSGYQYFICSIISDFEYFFIMNNLSPLPHSRTLPRNIWESYSSGIFTTSRRFY